MLYKNIFNAFTPKLIKIDELDLVPINNLMVYGEVHGAVENADIVYTLCNKLEVQCLAVEYSSSVDGFIKSAAADNIDFSLVDSDMFDSSILSIEMLKTIVELVKFGVIQQIKYLDGTFSYTNEQLKTLKPESREKHIADSILALDYMVPTLCILGNWHTRPRKVGEHVSALMRVRRSIPNVTLIYNKYGRGSVRNVGDIIKLPTNSKLPDRYIIIQKARNNFELMVPVAHSIRVK